MTFLQAAMSSLCFPQGKRRECTYVCERGCMSARNPRSCWLVAGPFPAPFVGGKLWSCREKQLTAKALKKTAEEEARGRELPKHTGFLYCKYSQWLQLTTNIRQAHFLLCVTYLNCGSKLSITLSLPGVRSQHLPSSKQNASLIDWG